MSSQQGAALVTGAAKRVGRAIALDLAANGYDVAVHYGSSGDAAEATVREIRAIGRSAEAVQADLSNAEDTDELVAAACDAVGPLTLLVNSASIFEPDRADSVTAAGFDRHMAINLRAPMILSRHFAGQVPDDRDGNVINIIDYRVWKLNPIYMSYTASKFGLWGITRTMAQALAPRVRVNGIGPGPVLANVRQDADEFRAEASATPLGRGPGLDEIGAAIRFIVATPSMTGQMIALDGGQHLAWRTPDVIAGDEQSG